MQKTGRNILAGASFAFALIPLVSQSLLSQTPASQKPTFEVTSVKPGAQTGFRGGGPRGNTFNVTGPLRIMVLMAYSRGIAGPGPGVPIQITGAPGWMDSELFDVQAKADCSSGTIPPEQMQLMLQSLLEERFQLKAHYETREMPLYHLVVVKEGKMKLSEDQTPPMSQTGGPLLCGPLPAPSAAPAGPRGAPFDPNKPSTFPRGSMVMNMNSTTGMTVTARATPIEGFVGMLQGRAGRTVIDKTNLKGLFDISLRFSPEVQPGLQGIGAPPPGAGGYCRSRRAGRHDAECRFRTVTLTLYGSPGTTRIEVGIDKRPSGNSGHRFGAETDAELKRWGVNAESPKAWRSRIL